MDDSRVMLQIVAALTDDSRESFMILEASFTPIDDVYSADIYYNDHRMKIKIRS
jgi:hypothetical protein